MKHFLFIISLIIFAFSGCTREVIVTESELAERHDKHVQESYKSILNNNFSAEFEIVEFLGNLQNHPYRNWYIVSFRGNKYLWRKYNRHETSTEVMVPYIEPAKAVD